MYYSTVPSLNVFVRLTQNNPLEKECTSVSISGYQWMYFSFCTIVSSTPYHPHYRGKNAEKKVFAKDAIQDWSTVN